MSKVLVIVESPAKAKTISKYLDSNYVVKSSIGHIRDLSTKNSISNNSAHSTKRSKENERDALINRMGIDPWNHWNAHYVVLPNKEKIVSELRKLAENADHIYLATDLDREGEAIAWHLMEVIGGDNKRYSRVVFNEITKKAIRQAFNTPVELNIDRVNAQQARRFMDRVVGYMISPLLWRKLARGLSAGRVQSVAVRLIVERERKIRAFVVEEYWKVDAKVMTSSCETLLLQVTHQNDVPFWPKNYDQAMKAISLLRKTNYQVFDRKDKTISSHPSAPFITSTLQQAASTYLDFSVKKTMLLAQHLYEAGYITYMRTDSTHLSSDAINMVRIFISENFSKKYLPKIANKFSSKKNSQEAHEAIRPSDVEIIPETLQDMALDAQKLYQLIWHQFVACQMTPAKYESTVLTVRAGDFCLKVKWRILRFDGWMKIIPSLCKGDKDTKLPMINIGDKLSLVELFPTQCFTKPPVRFNESSLVKELEKRGIGRPSTYASIISTIQDRGYVRMENHLLYAEKIGEVVTDRLEKNFHELMNYDFTAHMENMLDQIADRKIEWKKTLDIFFQSLIKQLDKAKKDPKDGGMKPNKMVMTSINCPTCGEKMGIRIATTGVFLGCSSYELSLKKRCKTTISLVPEEKIFNLHQDNNVETNALRSRRRCKKCDIAMDIYLINSRSRLHICGNNPICECYEIEDGWFNYKNIDNQIIECEKCGYEMNPKIGRFGRYIACTNEYCKNTRKILHNGKIASPKEDPVLLPELLCNKSDAYFVLRNGRAGIFLAANTFPKSRETRAPLVEELYRFRNRLPKKFCYLADAPQQDPYGNKAVVLFNRKIKQQYVATNKDGRTTGWSAFFVDGKWVEKIR